MPGVGDGAPAVAGLGDWDAALAFLPASREAIPGNAMLAPTGGPGARRRWRRRARSSPCLAGGCGVPGAEGTVRGPTGARGTGGTRRRGDAQDPGIADTGRSRRPP